MPLIFFAKKQKTSYKLLTFFLCCSIIKEKRLLPESEDPMEHYAVINRNRGGDQFETFFKTDLEAAISFAKKEWSVYLTKQEKKNIEFYGVTKHKVDEEGEMDFSSYDVVLDMQVVDRLWNTVNGADTVEEIVEAELDVRSAAHERKGITNDEFDELMRAISFKFRELNREERF